MPAVGNRSATRRSLVPEAAGRSLWLAAVWTGAGAAVVAAVTAIAAVAIVWLPAANGSGNATSAFRAGVLTFLAALHGGVTVDGLPAQFVPLGMTLAVALIAWRAGAGLADVTDQLAESRPLFLVRAGLAQAAAFAVVSVVAAHFATLGTSRVSMLAAGLAGFVLFAVCGGTAFARSSALRGHLSDVLPDWTGTALRTAAAALAVYLAAGALLVAGALVVHHHRVVALSHEVGGGWSGVPVLLLGVLAAPNAVIAGAAYLSGPGFALGSGSAVSLGSTVHGTLPAFPVLGAVPAGPATAPVWVLVAVTPLVAGVAAARTAGAGTSAGWRAVLRNIGAATAVVAVAGVVLAWQAGGAIGSGRLSAFGASPWQFGAAVAGAACAVTMAATGVLALLRWWQGRRETDGSGDRPVLVPVAGEADLAVPEDDAGTDILAG